MDQISIDRVVSEQLKTRVIVHQKIKFEDVWLLHIRTTEEPEVNHIPLEGIVLLHEGWNGKWRVGDAYLSVGGSEMRIENFEKSGQEYMAVFGENLIGGHVTAGVKSKFHHEIEFDVKDQSSFLVVLEEKIFKSEVEYYYLIDQTGLRTFFEIEMADDQSYVKMESGPEEIVEISSALIILIGFILSSAYAPKYNWLERVYTKYVHKSA